MTRAGPPAKLAVDGGGGLEVGTRALLGQLRVLVCDAAGNPTACDGFEARSRCTGHCAELAPDRATATRGKPGPLLCTCTMQVVLSNSALATDGSGASASVSASGGNKLKVKKGVAAFKDVRLSAEAPGSYALRVQCASRKARSGCMV